MTDMRQALREAALRQMYRATQEANWALTLTVAEGHEKYRRAQLRIASARRMLEGLGW